MMRRRARRGVEHKEPFDQQGAGQHGSDTQNDGATVLVPRSPLPRKATCRHLLRGAAAGAQQFNTGLQDSSQVSYLMDETGNAFRFGRDGRLPSVPVP